MPKWFEKDFWVNETPVKFPSIQSLDSKITIPVIVQTINVSINGPIIATSPDLMGWLFFEAPIAITSVPIPASFENAALLNPWLITIAVPAKPPATELPLNALEMIFEIIDHKNKVMVNSD